MMLPDTNQASQNPVSSPSIPLDYLRVPVDDEGNGSPIIWFLAFLFFPYGPFLYLARLRAMSWTLAIFFVLASLVVIDGTVSVLIKARGQSLEMWLVLVLNLSVYCFGLFQYIIGVRHNIWSRLGRRLWLAAAWFIGSILLIDLLTHIIQFNLTGHF
jgi:hypothetical protein